MLILILLALTACAAQPVPVPAENSDYSRALLQQINRYRLEHGLEVAQRALGLRLDVGVGQAGPQQIDRDQPPFAVEFHLPAPLLDAFEQRRKGMRVPLRHVRGGCRGSRRHDRGT